MSKNSSDKSRIKKQTPPRVTKPTKKKSLTSEEKFALAFKHSPIGICISTLHGGRYVEVNDIYSNFLGYSRDELIGRTSSDINLWADEAERDALIGEVLQKGSVVGFELRFRDKKGNIHWGYVSAAPVKIGEESCILTQTQDITEKKKIEDGYRKSEALYRLIADNVNDAIFTLDMNFNYTYASPSSVNIIGYAPEEITTMRVDQLVDEKILNWFAGMLAEELEIEKRPDRDLKRSRVLEYQHIRKDGSKVWVETKLTFIRDANNTAIGMQGIVRDISQRKKIERDLEKSEAMYRLLADNLTDIIFTMDMDLNYTYVSPSAFHVAGYTPEELANIKIADMIEPETLNRFMDILAGELEIEKQSAKDLKRSLTLEYQHQHKNGSKIWIEATLTFLRNEKNQAVGIIGTAHDISERKKIEEDLKKSESFFKEISENSSDVIVITDKKGRIKYCSPSFERFTGYSTEEALGKNTSSFIYPDDVEAAIHVFNEAVQSKTKAIPHELRIIHKNGSVRHFAGLGKFLLNNPYISGIVMNINDVTEQKKAEENLLREEQMFRALAEQSSDIIALVNREGVITYENPAMETALGYKVKERIGASGFEFIHPDDMKIVTDASKILFNDIHAPVQKAEVRFHHSNGSWKLFEVTASNLVNGGVIEAAVINMHDITERKRAEESLRQSEEKYRTILENMQEGYFETDFEGNFTFFNDITCQHFGYSRRELMNLLPRQYMDGETMKDIFKICRRIYKTAEPARDIHWHILRKDGTRREIEGSIFLLQDASGKKIGFKGIAHDVTEQKREKELLKHSEEKYRLLADHMKDQVWIMDLNLNVTYVSPSVEKLLGYTFDELKIMPLGQLLTPESFEKAMDFFSVEMPTALAAPSDYVLNRSLELQFRAKDGHTFWGESMFSFIRDEDGKPVAVLGEGRNITERKKMESDMRISEENFHRSLDESPLGVRISTAIGKTIYANRAILDIYGYDSVEELENTPLRERYSPESYAEFQARKEKRLKGEPGPSEYEISIIRKNGEIRHLYVFRKEIFWNGQKQSQVIYQDITLRRQAEEKLSATLENLRQSIKVTIQVLGMASEAKDPYMAGHQKRVADLARAIATEMKLPYDKIEAIRMAGAIHDIGKISVPSEILCKPAVLSDLEFSFIKNHPVYSYDIIKEVESPWPLADIVHQHHERINGTGYPLGLKNGEILVESRILAVADVVEAMISYRPYRPALELDIALAEIENNAGVLYDRSVVDACLRLFREKKFQMS